jgi:hypothetical protein
MSDSEQRAAGFIGKAYRLSFGVVTHNSAYESREPVRDILARFPVDMSGMEACPHVNKLLAPALFKASSEDPPLVLWAAWKPELLACPECSSALDISGSEENYRCDGCGNLADILTSGSAVIPSETDDFPSLVCIYGLCAQCAKDSGLRSSQTGNPKS